MLDSCFCLCQQIFQHCDTKISVWWNMSTSFTESCLFESLHKGSYDTKIKSSVFFSVLSGCYFKVNYIVQNHNNQELPRGLWQLYIYIISMSNHLRVSSSCFALSAESWNSYDFATATVVSIVPRSNSCMELRNKWWKGTLFKCENYVAKMALHFQISINTWGEGGKSIPRYDNNDYLDHL